MRASSWQAQGGGIAIIVALSLLVLVGFAGLVLDLGRLYVNKSELQTAADACALAAAAELSCDAAQPGVCTAAHLQRAESSGKLAGERNTRDFQNNAVSIALSDIRFSTLFAPNSTYLASGSADPNSKFAMCIARATGIVPWFMGVMGAGPGSVSATAVATLQPSQNFCSLVPLGLCQSGAGSYTPGQWLSSNFTTGGSGEEIEGSFRWVDFTPNAGGSNEIRDQLAGTDQVCNLTIGSDIEQAGVHQGAKSAYNTRFGMYPNGANAYTAQTAPPDRTGYAYPNKAPGSPVIDIGTSALADFLARQNAGDPFTDSEYGVSGPGGNIPGNPSGSATHLASGAERRLVTVPIVDCTAGNIVPIISMACVLMLNPMSNGASGTIYLEYIGLADAIDTPCHTSGTPGTSGGPFVPTLVQ